MRLINITFHPAKYPEFFKPIEDKPKWIDYTVNFNTMGNGGVQQIPVKPRRYDLFTWEDMIEFAEYCIIEYPDIISESIVKSCIEKWINKKLQS